MPTQSAARAAARRCKCLPCFSMVQGDSKRGNNSGDRPPRQERSSPVQPERPAGSRLGADIVGQIHSSCGAGRGCPKGGCSLPQRFSRYPQIV
jgi:hypothetical protein